MNYDKTTMRNIKYSLMIFASLFVQQSCSKEKDATTCPETEYISMKINGETMQFKASGRGIDLNEDGLGHTLSLFNFAGVLSPKQDSYSITLKLPYKKTGIDIIEEFSYFRVQNTSSARVDFVQGELHSEVNVNTNTCFSATFSGRAIIDGNEIIITEGTMNRIYSEPFY
jgi:hypothetical protein